MNSRRRSDGCAAAAAAAPVFCVLCLSKALHGTLPPPSGVTRGRLARQVLLLHLIDAKRAILLCKIVIIQCYSFKQTSTCIYY